MMIYNKYNKKAFIYLFPAFLMMILRIFVLNLFRQGN